MVEQGAQARVDYNVAQGEWVARQVELLPKPERPSRNGQRGQCPNPRRSSRERGEPRPLEFTGEPGGSSHGVFPRTGR